MSVKAAPRLWRRVAKAHAMPLLAAGAMTLAGCATYYDLTLLPRDGGKPAYGTAHDLGPGQASVSIAVADKVYRGTWVQTTPERSMTYVGASSWGWWDWGTSGAADRAYGEVVAKALLQAFDGSALRCDFFGLTGGQATGKCIDDKGLIFDVQIRSRNLK